ncbi:MAG TPA: DUF373 family protein [Methanosarcinales archaeon]|nr:DUF373 family protein [Methanosarcinales archaeon]
MKTLIICLDRDNDLGRKANIDSPIIGRENNINAAVQLAIADPEDSDTNTIFGGIHVYDKLLKNGMDVEIVSIAGDKEVGIVSDQKISLQLDDILNKIKPDHAIVVSDGAEDESVIPIIQSRIKIDSVKRVIVKQSEKLESTYYIIKQLFKDPKISHTFFIPIGLACLIFGISWILKRPELSISAILVAIGIYMLYRGFGIDDALENFRTNMEQSLYGGKITFVTYTISIILIIIATALGIIKTSQFYLQSEVYTVGYLPLALIYIRASVWWYVASGIFAGIGRIINLYLENKPIERSWSFPFFVFASGLLFWGASNYLLSVGFNNNISSKESLQYLVFSIVFAVIIALIGIRLSVKTKIVSSEL